MTDSLSAANELEQFEMKAKTHNSRCIMANFYPKSKNHTQTYQLQRRTELFPKHGTSLPLCSVTSQWPDCHAAGEQVGAHGFSEHVVTYAHSLIVDLWLA
jgi:hypothetical protein